MIAWAILLSVTLLTSPDEMERQIAAPLTAARKADNAAGVAERKPGTAEGPRSLCVSGMRSDFDRSEGVVMFEGDVLVDYGGEGSMASDRLFIFMKGTNELSRIVAVGHVAVTNGTRVGSCATAVYHRQSGEIEMYGDGKGVLAEFGDTSEGGSSAAGTHIRFRLGAEQVEVEDSQPKFERREGDRIL